MVTMNVIYLAIVLGIIMIIQGVYMLIQSKSVWNKIRDMTPCPIQIIPTPRTGRHPLDKKYKRIINKYKLLYPCVKQLTQKGDNMTDKSYMTSKTPEERWAYVEAQLKAGNPKYKPKGQWIADNKEMIGINALTKKVDILTEMFLKLSKSQSK